MRRALVWLLPLLALAGCDFPEVPRGANPYPAWRPLAEGDERRAALDRAHEVRGLLAGNAVSSLVIQREDGGWQTVQIGPDTRLFIGDVPAGLRELQPGSRVRARFVPIDADTAVALEVRAEPASVGWGEPRR